VYRQPPLLIVAPLADDLDLARLPWCDAARGNVTVNRAKFKNLDMVEVIVDAMPFLLTRLTEEETSGKLSAGTCNLPFGDQPFSGGSAIGIAPFGDQPFSGGSAIGIAPGANLACASHVPETHRRLLLLGRSIGQGLEATAAAWMPAGTLGSFAWFVDTVDQYLADDRFPYPLHFAVSQVSSDQFLTRGLRYFTGQEIRLTIPPDYGLAAISERMEEIIAEVIAHGRIDGPSRSECPARGETLIYTPSESPERVDILIRRDARHNIAAERQGC